MSLPAAELRDHIERDRIVAILRPARAEEVSTALEACAEAGLRTAEISLATPVGRAALAPAVDRFGERLRVGAGTVRTVAHAEFAAAAGAEYLVSPAYDADVDEWAAARDLLYVPGVFTPTEVETASRRGPRLLKLFPAGRLGPGYVRDLAAPFPEARFLATGGVDASSAADFIAAGAAGAALGGALVPSGGGLSKNEIAQRARELRKRVPFIDDRS